MSIFAQFATAFGLGRAGKAPGTLGSLAAIVIAVPVMWLTGWMGMMALALITTLFGVWAADGYFIEVDKDDPQDCIIDEFAGQWLTCAIGGLAAMPGDPAMSWAGFVLSFLLFRLFDIAKPWLVKKAENLRGGLGIMADDVVAGVFAGVVVFLFAYSGFI
jgi:phosphatidylglycerophosphatase A